MSLSVLIPGTLPQGICQLWTDPQSFLNSIAQYLSVQLPTAIGGLVLSATKPSYDPASPAAWGKLDNQGRLVRIFVFAQGSWISPHTSPPNAIIMTDQSVTEVTITDSDGTAHIYCDFDGGSAAAPTPYSGAFWEKVYGGLFPVGAGVTPTVASMGSDNFVGGTNLQLGESKGDQRILPDFAHTHIFGRQIVSGFDNYRFTIATTGNTAPDLLSHVIAGAAQGGNGNGETTLGSAGNTGPYLETGPMAQTASGVATQNNMPQYIALNILRRTSRLFYSE